MSKIYLFLQRRIMRENRYGLQMVLIAYIVALLLLVFGSDALYEIRSKAKESKAGQTEAELPLSLNKIETVTAKQEMLLLKSNLINPYGLPDAGPYVLQQEMMPAGHVVQALGYTLDRTIYQVPATGDTGIEDETSEDTRWFMGYSLDTEEYQALIDQIDEAGIAPKEEQVTTADKKEVESFSIAADKKLSVTKEEIKMLERIVEAEAEGEDMTGKILIVNVILNRLKDDEFPDTIKGVIFQKVGGEYQFSPVAGDRYWEVEISDNTRKAVQRALDGEDYSKGALYFMARKKTRNSSAKWFDENLKWLFKHGGHEFFK